MILQALTQYYDALNARGEIDAPGWGRPKISYALQLRENGELTQVIPLLHEVDAGKKKVLRPREDIHLPAAVKRSSGVASNFMWDNSAYLLGIDAKGKPERSLQCFHAAAELHHKLLDTVDSPFAHAILSPSLIHGSLPKLHSTLLLSMITTKSFPVPIWYFM